MMILGLSWAMTAKAEPATVVVLSSISYLAFTDISFSLSSYCPASQLLHLLLQLMSVLRPLV